LWTDPGGREGKNKNDKDAADVDPASEGANGDHLQGGRFLIDLNRKRAPLAVAAPGLH
jgi:hypothetical protein